MISELALKLFAAFSMLLLGVGAALLPNAQPLAVFRGFDSSFACAVDFEPRDPIHIDEMEVDSLDIW